MADKILHKRSLASGSIPTTSSLEIGELAINVYDGKLFLHQSGSNENIVTVGESASFATSASYALTASYIEGGGGGGVVFPYTGSAIISGSLIVTGSIYTNSPIYSPFVIGLNFETNTPYVFNAPYSFYISSSESNPSGSITIKYQASGSAVTSSYVYGNTVNKFDSLIITPPTISLVILNSVRI
jgi:hypothetical protein